MVANQIRVIQIVKTLASWATLVFLLAISCWRPLCPILSFLLVKVPLRVFQEQLKCFSPGGILRLTSEKKNGCDKSWTIATGFEISKIFKISAVASA